MPHSMILAPVSPEESKNMKIKAPKITKDMDAWNERTASLSTKKAVQDVAQALPVLK